MNRFESSPDKPSDSIRSEIDDTRQRMNTTIDALSERLKGRHLVDELLGFLRSGNGSNAAASVKNKVAETTQATLHAVIDTVKAHPLPVLAMGAGLAWLIYEKERATHGPRGSYAAFDPEPRSPSMGTEPISDFEDYTAGYSTTGEPLAGTEPFAEGGFEPGLAPEPGMTERIQEKAGHAKERIQAKASQLAGKASEMGDRARHGLQNLKQRTSQAGAQVRDRTREVAARTKDQVTHAAQEHPLETGLTCLAVGLLAGLLTPTPQRVRDEVGPMAQRLKQRAQQAGEDVVARGKRVVAAATEAAREEAETQGLTAEAMLHRRTGENREEDRHAGPTRPKGDWPGQNEDTSPPTPAMRAAATSDERRSAGDAGPPTPVPPQPSL